MENFSFRLVILFFSILLSITSLNSSALGLNNTSPDIPLRSLVEFVKKPRVTAIETEKLFDRTRLVLYISSPSNLSYDISREGTVIFINFVNIDWIAAPFEPRHSAGNIIEFRYSPNNIGGTLNIITEQPVKLQKPFLMHSSKIPGKKIVFDLVPINKNIQELKASN
mgnify:FL=1